jgi:predicted nuclease of predicted toxin-antitoxin system
MQLLIDMNLTPRWVAFLMSGGHHAVHWSDVGDVKAADADITEWARRQGYCVVTNDTRLPSNTRAQRIVRTECHPASRRTADS